MTKKKSSKKINQHKKEPLEVRLLIFNDPYLFGKYLQGKKGGKG